MNHNEAKKTVGQNPELSEEISWQESAICGKVFMLKTGGYVFQVCFPITFIVNSFSFFNYQKLSSQTTGGIF